MNFYKLNHQIQINILNEIKKSLSRQISIKSIFWNNAISKEFIKYENLGDV